MLAVIAWGLIFIGGEDVPFTLRAAIWYLWFSPVRFAPGPDGIGDLARPRVQTTGITGTGRMRRERFRY